MFILSIAAWESIAVAKLNSSRACLTVSKSHYHVRGRRDCAALRFMQPRPEIAVVECGASAAVPRSCARQIPRYCSRTCRHCQLSNEDSSCEAGQKFTTGAEIPAHMGNAMKEQRSSMDLSSHFAFGENWASFAQRLNWEQICEAENGLVRLLGKDGLRGKNLLDIGCGSGLPALAAARLGASRVVAVDIDPKCVETAQQLLNRYVPDLDWEVRPLSVFDLTPEHFGTFDVVYSWGVLHHTGAMNEAIKRAARLVNPRGLLALALYRSTRMCGFWKWEKRWYSKASPRAQRLAQQTYVAVMRAAFWVARRELKRKSGRGMDYWHDLHDWLGGYPYESISAEDVDSVMRRLGFDCERRFIEPFSTGLFGSGCNEYVYRCRADRTTAGLAPSALPLSA